MTLSNTLTRLGQVEEGVRLGQEGIAVCRELGDRGEIAFALGELATALAFQGRYAESQAMFEESRDLKSDLRHRTGLPGTTMALSHIEMHLGWYGQARDRAQDALTLAREQSQQRIVGNALYLLGGLPLIREAYAEARQLLRESVSATQSYGQQDELGRHVATLGYAVRGAGSRSEARRLFCAALRLGAELEAMMPIWWGLPGISLLLADAGDVERAVELYALVTRYAVMGNSRWWEDIAGRHIAAVAETLPPAVVAASQERGRARDLQATVAELLVEFAELWTG